MLVREFDQALVGTDYREAGPVRVTTRGGHIARVEALSAAIEEGSGFGSLPGYEVE